MSEIYVYNASTKVIHIYGYCNNSKYPAYPHYKSKDELYKAAGTDGIRECKTCAKIRDSLLEKNINTKG